MKESRELEVNESEYLQVAKEAAIKAGGVVAKLYGKKHSLKYKSDPSDFATEADLESERIILEIITKNFPDHNILSEELGRNQSRESPYTWVIDPLDGTTTFVAGLPFFSISIGLLKNGQSIVGVINRVSEDELYWAERGKGTFLNKQKIMVSKKDLLKDSVLGLEYAYAHMREEEIETVHKRLVAKVRYPFTFGGTAVSLALVARGILDGYYHTAHPWDFVAGALLVEEAGGRITDFEGKPLDWSKDWMEVVATNGMIHKQMLAILNR